MDHMPWTTDLKSMFLVHTPRTIPLTSMKNVARPVIRMPTRCISETKWYSFVNHGPTDLARAP